MVPPPLLISTVLQNPIRVQILMFLDQRLTLVIPLRHPNLTDQLLPMSLNLTDQLLPMSLNLTGQLLPMSRNLTDQLVPVRHLNLTDHPHPSYLVNPDLIILTGIE